MLVVYTPNDQTEETIEQIRRKAASWRDPRMTQPQQVEGKYLVTFKTSWCRELACGTLFDLVGSLPPGKLDIYGIRKHGTSWRNQPTDSIGEIRHPDRYTNIMFTNLFQLMTEMFSYVLETEHFHQYTPGTFTNRLFRNEKITCSPQIGQPKCLLNIDKATPPSELIEETSGLYGTMYNIPSEWSKYRVVMSYLLYLPRVWGGFYEETEMLKRLSKPSQPRFNDEFLARVCAEETEDRKESALVLWLQLARRLMLPMWFTNYGRSQFWVFTYMVIREGLAVRDDLSRIPGFQTALGSIDCSGFMSWFRKYKCQLEHDAPTWVSSLFNLLQDRGPFSILRPRTIAKHI